MAEIEKTDNTTRWEECGETSLLTRCWYKYVTFQVYSARGSLPGLDVHSTNETFSLCITIYFKSKISQDSAEAPC